LSTGTGIAPFASLIRDPETYEKFDEVILTHTCREVSELRYGVELVEHIRGDAMLRELFDTAKLRHYTTATREPHARTGRITDLIASRTLFDDLGVPPLDPATDRAMICGSAQMLNDTKALLEAAGLVEGSNSRPAQFVIERAFAG